MTVSRLALLALALAAALAACDSEQGAVPAATETPVTAAPADATGDRAEAPDAAIAAGEIPPRFHGVWDAVTGTCDPASDLRVEIGARRITFHESIGDVAGVGSEGADTMADLVMRGEGEEWVRPMRLRLQSTPEGERLLISEIETPEAAGTLPRKRCRA